MKTHPGTRCPRQSTHDPTNAAEERAYVRGLKKALIHETADHNPVTIPSGKGNRLDRLTPIRTHVPSASVRGMR